MKNGQMDRGNENPIQNFAFMTEGNYEKNQVRVVGNGIWIRDLPNTGPVCYPTAPPSICIS